MLIFYLQDAPEQLRQVARAEAAVAQDETFLLLGHDSANLQDDHGDPQNPQSLYAVDDVAADRDDELQIERTECVERPVQTPDGGRTAAGRARACAARPLTFDTEQLVFRPSPSSLPSNAARHAVSPDPVSLCMPRRQAASP